MRLSAALLVPVFIAGVVAENTGIAVGGVLEEIGQLLSSTLSIDSSTFQGAVISASFVVLQAPLLALYRIGAEIVSIVALSLFISFLAVQMGYESPFPYFRKVFVDPIEKTFYDSYYKLPPEDESYSDDRIISHTYLVQLNPEKPSRPFTNKLETYGRSISSDSSLRIANSFLKRFGEEMQNPSHFQLNSSLSPTLHRTGNKSKHKSPQPLTARSSKLTTKDQSDPRTSAASSFISHITDYLVKKMFNLKDTLAKGKKYLHSPYLQSIPKIILQVIYDIHKNTSRMI